MRMVGLGVTPWTTKSISRLTMNWAARNMLCFYPSDKIQHSVLAAAVQALSSQFAGASCTPSCFRALVSPVRLSMGHAPRHPNVLRVSPPINIPTMPSSHVHPCLSLCLFICPLQGQKLNILATIRPAHSPANCDHHKSMFLRTGKRLGCSSRIQLTMLESTYRHGLLHTTLILPWTN